MMQDNVQFFATIRTLVEAWCDRRCLGALRSILVGYPMASPLTDGWAELDKALRDVRAFARDELTQQELEIVSDLIRVTDKVIHR